MRFEDVSHEKRQTDTHRFSLVIVLFCLEYILFLPYVFFVIVLFMGDKITSWSECLSHFLLQLAFSVALSMLKQFHDAEAIIIPKRRFEEAAIYSHDAVNFPSWSLNDSHQNVLLLIELEIWRSWQVKWKQDQVNNANSAIIFLINQWSFRIVQVVWLVRVVQVVQHVQIVQGVQVIQVV